MPALEQKPKQWAKSLSTWINYPCFINLIHILLIYFLAAVLEFRAGATRFLQNTLEFKRPKTSWLPPPSWCSFPPKIYKKTWKLSFAALLFVFFSKAKSATRRPDDPVAFEMVTHCCSMASWMATRSAWFILRSCFFLFGFSRFPVKRSDFVGLHSAKSGFLGWILSTFNQAFFLKISVAILQFRSI